jgi:acyl-coenzyme A thioesterase PaaI-like protein
MSLGHTQGGRVSGPTVELRVDLAAEPATQARWLFGQGSLRYLGSGGALLGAEVTDDTSRSIAVASAWFVALPSGSEPAPPISGCAGQFDGPGSLLAALAAGRPRSAGPGDDGRWEVSAAPAMSNPRDQVHGGVLLAIGRRAQWHAQHTDVADAGALRPLSLTAEYLRPVPADGAAVSCRSSYVRRGRAFRTLRTELLRADGKVAATVTGLWTSAG